MPVVLFIATIAVLVLVHELGHFLAAKRLGIRVDEFGLGFPPRLFGTKVGETVYSVNIIPFGGFVKIFGEKPGGRQLSDQDQKGSFSSKPKRVQAAVLFAGVAFNWLFAWFLISTGFVFGMPVPIEGYEGKGEIRDRRLLVVTVLPDSPAEAAGLRPGDVIKDLSTDSDTIQNPSAETVRRFIASREGEKFDVRYRRGEAEGRVPVTPRFSAPDGRAIIGISMEEVGTLSLLPHKAFLEGAKTTVRVTGVVATELVDFIIESFRGQTSVSDITGPVGIVGLVGEAGSLGFIYLLSFVAFISINLAVLNLVPFPALDGGRLLFLAVEALLRRPIKPEIQNVSNAIGLAILLVFMAVVTYHDIARLVGS